MATNPNIKLTDTFATWVKKINTGIDYLNTFDIGDGDANVPTVALVDQKIQDLNTDITNRMGTMNTTINEKIDNNAAKAYSDSIAMVIALS